MHKIYFRSVKESKIKVIDKFRVGSWINVYDPNKEEIEKILGEIEIDRSLLTDALDRHEVPRMENKKGIIYVFARFPKEKKGEIRTSPLLVAIGNDFILTLSKNECPFLNQFIEQEEDVYTTQKIKFFLEIFFAINKEYSNILIGLNKRIRSVKFRLEKIDKKDIVQFIDFERILNDFLSALVPTNAVLKNLLDGRHIESFEEDNNLIEDLFFGNSQLIEMTRATLRHAVNIRDAYTNIMTHDLNRVIKLFTALTIILTIPTMIFSFYGMNTRLPFAEFQFASEGLFLGTFLICIFLLFVFVKKDGFRKRLFNI